ncbi:gp53-like domain-containing protein [Mangrovibacter plantisponsor]|uniref:Putative tail fiber protein gp53-like C-terminal domain-containing protein n=1 Tax=Mangrovibacter plantisponsor TaxID=451513 RepID=A0A317PXD1_9ENTR|nr:hypothetical protein [Mangrovibacter plantisponsor]PWW07831.1 hypothetical protein DES37_108259 [Mangrovibacter plantisponsor]
MHRIDSSTAQADKFGEGKNGFTGGNPQTGELPTALDADYFDSVQEEICGVIEAAGIALDKTQRNQLLTALPLLFLSRANPFADIAADGAAAIATSLANLGLGDIVLAGVCSGVFGNPGRILIPAIIGGAKQTLIFQWGNIGNGGSGSAGTATLGTTFPNGALGGVLTSYDTTSGGNCVTRTSLSNSSISALFKDLTINYPFTPVRLLTANYFVWGY